MKTNKEKQGVKKYNLRHHPNGFKITLIDRLVRGKESANQVAISLGIPGTTLHAYRKQLLEELGFFRILYEMKKQKSTEKSTSNLEKENEALKQALELSILKVAGLETMIDIAEEQFNIDIRKKSGAKQSKS